MEALLQTPNFVQNGQTKKLEEQLNQEKQEDCRGI